MTVIFDAAQELPFLEQEHERQLLRSWQVDGDRDALNALVFSHTKLVRSWAAKFSKDPQNREELMAEGYLGLVKAANEFDLSRPVRFSTYARWWVRNHIATGNTKITSYFSAAASKSNDPNTPPPSVTCDNDLVDSLQSYEAGPEEHIVHQSTLRGIRKTIVEAMLCLSDVEREVIIARNIRPSAEPLVELANRLSLTSDHLRMVERRAFSRLKYELLSRGVSSHRGH